MTTRDLVLLSLEAGYVAVTVLNLTGDDGIVDRLRTVGRNELTREFLDTLKVQYISQYKLEPDALDVTPEFRERMEVVLPIAIKLQERVDAIRRAARQ